MINKKQFIDFITSYQTFYNSIIRLENAISGSKRHSCNLLESDWGGAVGIMLDRFLESFLTNDGQDLIFWWLFEDVDKIIIHTEPPTLFNNKEKIEYNVEDLEDFWNYLIKYKDEYFLE